MAAHKSLRTAVIESGIERCERTRLVRRRSVGSKMRMIWVVLCSASLAAAGVAVAQNGPYGSGGGQLVPGGGEQLMALANRSRADAGASRLKWDSALAEAARKHCEWMVSEGQIAHRYGGEADLTERAGQAGAHFSLIEENVAVGPSTEVIHDGWMHSPGHRTNLLNPEVDHVGIAVIAARGTLWAVADYTRAVQTMGPAEVESRIAALIRPSGVKVLGDPTRAREACRADQGIPRAQGGAQPTFVMRWQGADLNRLPQPLVEKLQSGQYRGAIVGSCPLQTDQSFSGYRLAVLLY